MSINELEKTQYYKISFIIEANMREAHDIMGSIVNRWCPNINIFSLPEKYLEKDEVLNLLGWEETQY